MPSRNQYSQRCFGSSSFPICIRTSERSLNASASVATHSANTSSAGNTCSNLNLCRAIAVGGSPAATVENRASTDAARATIADVVVMVNPFTPGKRLTRPELFSGRTEQLENGVRLLARAANANVRHGLITGDRGIG